MEKLEKIKGTIVVILLSHPIFRESSGLTALFTTIKPAVGQESPGGEAEYESHM